MVSNLFLKRLSCLYLISCIILCKEIEELFRKILHLDNHPPCHAEIIIVRYDSRYCSNKTKSSCYQRLCYAGRYNRKRCSAGCSDTPEGIHYSPDSSKQADKWSR